MTGPEKGTCGCGLGLGALSLALSSGHLEPPFSLPSAFPIFLKMPRSSICRVWEEGECVNNCSGGCAERKNLFLGGKRKTYFEEWRESSIVVGLCDGNGKSEGAGAVECEHEEAEIETHLFFWFGGEEMGKICWCIGGFD